MVSSQCLGHERRDLFFVCRGKEEGRALAVDEAEKL